MCVLVILSPGENKKKMQHLGESYHLCPDVDQRFLWKWWL